MVNLVSLQAMLLNERELNTAYERLNCHETKWKDAVTVLTRGLGNERRHQHWLETILEQ
ncbi:hypothetical protein [Legionella hackeliae]|uniref:Uncharacterized protein n=1 Tax=Legionella hackeliae TaxID=449 RepID=A0A0A8UV59_LEGHA|nr:hypothetical protein [Legionella hackeliae]CEK10992.1 conserved protein of unknown function [Legionella hackeliae]STX47732.1 Uncharacterised protein [Legionella hackeliae]